MNEFDVKLKEFPWLWGIRQDWNDVKLTNIVIHNSEELEKFQDDKAVESQFLPGTMRVFVLWRAENRVCLRHMVVGGQEITYGKALEQFFAHYNGKITFSVIEAIAFSMDYSFHNPIPGANCLEKLFVRRGRKGSFTPILRKILAKYK